MMANSALIRNRMTEKKSIGRSKDTIFLIKHSLKLFSERSFSHRQQIVIHAMQYVFKDKVHE